MDEAAILNVDALSKIFYTNKGEEIRAVDSISFTVRRGEIFGLLGPNGAGKTTTIGMLTTRVRISGGRAEVAGFDVAADPIGVRHEIAVVPQTINLDRSLTARENLIFHAKYFGIDRETREKKADELLDLMDLAKRADDYPSRFSEGMARRLLIARALMHAPKLIFLDEATAGLDPQSRLMIWHKIRELNESGHTIIMTTHYMEEADQLCDRVAILDNGKILALDDPVKLKEIVPGGNVVELKTVHHCEPLAGWLQDELDGLRRVECENSSLRLYLDHPEENLVKIIGITQKHGIPVEAIQLHGVTLEDVFLQLTGKGLRE